ncbi:hypothetical protein NQZ68_025106 [Dissostichus eleginoides]|nr:hypothetical protein NQZ68_025106 [Dissostichus eleginoides]
MQMKGDKNSALPTADIQPDGQTKGFNQPNKEETHAGLSKHARCQGYVQTLGSWHSLHDRCPATLDSPTHLIPEEKA